MLFRSSNQLIIQLIYLSKLYFTPTTQQYYHSLDPLVIEYLRFRGFSSMATQFEKASAESQVLEDAEQTTQQIMQLAAEGDFQHLFTLLQRFSDQFISNNIQLKQASNLIQVEIFKICLYNIIIHNKPVLDAATRLNQLFPRQFDAYLGQNLKKDEQICVYEGGMVVQGITVQLANVVNAAFASRKIPALVGAVGQQFERDALAAEIMWLRGQVVK